MLSLQGKLMNLICGVFISITQSLIINHIAHVIVSLKALVLHSHSQLECRVSFCFKRTIMVPSTLAVTKTALPLMVHIKISILVLFKYHIFKCNLEFFSSFKAFHHRPLNQKPRSDLTFLKMF